MKRPACVFCFTGLLTQLAAVCLPQAAFWLLAAFCIVVTLLCGFRFRLRAVVAVLLGVGVSLLLWANTQYRLVRPAQQLSGRTVTVTAVVLEKSPGYAEDMVRADLQLLSVDGTAAAGKVRCPCLPDCAMGDVITAELSFAALQPDSTSWGSFADGIFLEGEYLSDFAITGTSTSVRFAMRRFGLLLSGNIRRYLEPSISGILAAMTTGDRRFLYPTHTRLFRKAGISHILVVSGLHVSALCGLIFPRGGTCRRRVAAAVLSILMAFFMMYIVGFTPSVVRAGVAAVILNLGVLLMRPGDSFTALGVAVFGMSAFNSYAVCDVALQLSFAATLGVLCGGELTRNWSEAEWAKSVPGNIAAQLVQNVVVSGCASAFTFPVLVFWGMQVSVVSLLANLFVVWLSRPILLAGFGAALFGLAPVFYPLYRGCVFVGGILVRILIALTEIFAALPGSQLTFETPFAGVAAIVLLVYIAVCIRCGVSVRRITVSCTLLLCSTIAVGTLLSSGLIRVALVGNTWSPAVVVTQGDSAAVLYRGGNYNKTQVHTYLEQRGITQPELLIDLRYSEDASSAPAADRYEALVQLEPFEARTFVWNGVTFSLYSSGEGGAVWMDLGGTSAAVVSGSVTTSQPIRTDILLAGSGNAADVQADTILTLHTGYKWLDETTAKDVYYGQKGLSILLRPHSGYKIKGAITSWQQSQN